VKREDTINERRQKIQKKKEDRKYRKQKEDREYKKQKKR